MKDINIKDLPKFKGKKIMNKAIDEHRSSKINGMNLNGDAELILGLCAVIQELNDRIENLEVWGKKI